MEPARSMMLSLPGTHHKHVIPLGRVSFPLLESLVQSACLLRHRKRGEFPEQTRQLPAREFPPVTLRVLVLEPVGGHIERIARRKLERVCREGMLFPAR